MTFFCHICEMQTYMFIVFFFRHTEPVSCLRNCFAPVPGAVVLGLFCGSLGWALRKEP